MSVVITTRGLEKLNHLAAVIRATGDRGLIRELDKTLRREQRPLLRSARQGALQTLPYRGGLADAVAASRFSSQVSTTGGRVSMTITAAGRYQLSQMDDGFVRHKVYGKWRRNTPTQRIRPGWFTNSLLLDAPRVQRSIEDGMTELGRQMEASV